MSNMNRQDRSPPMRNRGENTASFNAAGSYMGSTGRNDRRSGSRDQYESNASSLIPNEEAMEKNMINKVNLGSYYGATGAGLNDRSQRIKEKYSSRGNSNNSRENNNNNAYNNRSDSRDSGGLRVYINPVTG